LARAALKHLDLVGKSNERDRRLRLASKSFRSKALLGENARGVLKSVNRALGVGQRATADQSVDNSELSDAAAHGLGRYRVSFATV